MIKFPFIIGRIQEHPSIHRDGLVAMARVLLSMRLQGEILVAIATFCWAQYAKTPLYCALHCVQPIFAPDGQN